MVEVCSLLISCFVWSTLYFTLCLLDPKHSYMWHIRSVTTIHAITVSVLGLYSVFVLGPWPFTHPGGESTEFQHFFVVVSLGYFLLDLPWCLYFKTEGPVMLVHHCCSIFALSYSFYEHWWGTELVATILMGEITNPLLQMRWFLRETKNHDTLIGEIVDVAFMVSFAFIRLVVGSYYVYSYWQMDTDFMGRLGGSLIYAISWVFMISIIKLGIKRYKKKYGVRSENGDKTIGNGVENNNIKTSSVRSPSNAEQEVTSSVHKRCLDGKVHAS